MENRYKMIKRSFVLVLLSLFVAFTVALVTGCDDEKEETTIEATLIGKDWVLQSAKVDGVSTDVYDGLILKFEQATYQANLINAMFESAGTWEKLSDPTMLKLDDALVISVEIVNAEKVLFKFTWDDTTYGPGRVSSIGGEHEFELTAQ